MSELVWLLLLHIVLSTNSVYCVSFFFLFVGSRCLLSCCCGEWPLGCVCLFGNSRSLPSLLQASAWRAQPPRLIPAAGAAARALPRTWRGWAIRQTSPWTTMPRGCGALILNRASRRPWPSILLVDAGRSSSLMRERCMVSTDVCMCELSVVCEDACLSVWVKLRQLWRIVWRFGK